MYKLSSQFIDFGKEQTNNNGYSNACKAIIKLLINGWSAPTDLKHILKVNHIGVIENLKFEALDLLMNYAKYILRDDYINEEEYNDFIVLKRVFKVREGDFLKFRQLELNEVLRLQFFKIYLDDKVDKNEALMKVDLQSLFDLSYEQFERIKEDEVIISILRGADPLQLNIAKRLNYRNQ